MAPTKTQRVNSLLFLYCETPLHAGVGAGVGHIDLPIQRERITNLPVLQASGLKGALRSALEIPARIPEARDRWRKIKDKESQEAKDEFNKFLPYDVLFGPDTDRAEVHAGALSLSDARLLLFPVRSLVGVFAWATCPLILERLCRDLELVHGELSALGNHLKALYEDREESNMFTREKALVTDQCDLCTGGRVLLEEFAFQAIDKEENQQTVSQIAKLLSAHVLPNGAHRYWKDGLSKKLVILHDEAFKALVTLGTEVTTRVAIDPEKGTVKRGALWTEEALPAESVLYSVASFSEPRAYGENGERIRQVSYPNGQEESTSENKRITDAASLRRFFQDKFPQDAPVQLGGDETVGRGWTRARLYSDGGPNHAGTGDANLGSGEGSVRVGEG